MRLKSWESPRREGRNSKGKGGAARQRQKKKQLQMLRKKLKNTTGKRNVISSLFFLARYYCNRQHLPFLSFL